MCSRHDRRAHKFILKRGEKNTRYKIHTYVVVFSFVCVIMGKYRCMYSSRGYRRGIVGSIYFRYVGSHSRPIHTIYILQAVPNPKKEKRSFDRIKGE